MPRQCHATRLQKQVAPASLQPGDPRSLERVRPSLLFLPAADDNPSSAHIIPVPELVSWLQELVGIYIFVRGKQIRGAFGMGQN